MSNYCRAALSLGLVLVAAGAVGAGAEDKEKK
jgi:hypothetical protein